MKIKEFLFALIAFLFLASAAQGGELVYSQLSDNQSTFGPSQLWLPTGVNSEVADDFEVIGNIDRVVASGFMWGTADFQGVYVRFYEFGADNKPGALQREYLFASGDPHVVFDPLSGSIDATLSPGFTASGRHFISVQPIINYWYWWSANIGAPRGQPFYFRNGTAGEGWHHGDNLNVNVDADVSFYLYGTPTGPGVIDSLSATTLPRSGLLEIFGNDFGGSGTVLIDGISAPVANWESTRIVAYAPEAARLTTVPVQVVNTTGQPSNFANLTVTARQANGRVNWRFRMNGPWAEVRPIIAADGTVYAIDVFSHLYALSPDGGLKWLARGAGDKGIALGADGSIYVASEDAIRAFDPDGTAKWTFVQNPRAMICLGVSVGPDGNIYSVGTQGMGVFSLTPAGTLRWTNPEGYARPIVDYGEIVFGPNSSQQQLYFYANNHLRAIGLDGSPVFTITGGLAQLKPGLQPVVAPDGSVHTVLWSYAPSGSLLWSFPTPYPYNVFTAADIDSAGIHYFVQNLSQLFALNPDGSQRWHVTVNGYVAGPVVDPFNTQLVLGSADTLDHAGFILSTSAKDGHELWRVILPLEDTTVFNPSIGIYGFNQHVDSRARFSADGSTAYVVTATATGDNNTSKSFIYSLNTTLINPPPPPPPASTLLRSTGISLTGKVSGNGQVSLTGVVTVKDQNGMAIPSATVTVTWKWPNGLTQNQIATTGTSGNANFSTKSSRGTYMLTVTNVAKKGYTFDRNSSVLTKSITK